MVAELRTRIAEGDIALVVGSGLTIATTGDQKYSWKGVLEDGFKTIGCSRGLSDNDDFIALASELKRLMNNKGEWVKWIKSLFLLGENNIKNDALLESIVQMGTPILTTNFDNLLDVFLGKKGMRRKSVNLVLDHGEVAKIVGKSGVIDSFNDIIIYLHGKASNPESIIFENQAYEEFIGNKKINFTKHIFSALLNGFLFVGCGDTLKDESIQILIDSSINHKGSDNLFRLISKHEQFDGNGIIHICYGEYEDLPRFLGNLKNGFRKFSINEYCNKITIYQGIYENNKEYIDFCMKTSSHLEMHEWMKKDFSSDNEILDMEKLYLRRTLRMGIKLRTTKTSPIQDIEEYIKKSIEVDAAVKSSWGRGGSFDVGGDCRELSDLLAAKSVIISGPSGSGKTTMARRLAWVYSSRIILSCNSYGDEEKHASLSISDLPLISECVPIFIDAQFFNESECCSPDFDEKSVIAKACLYSLRFPAGSKGYCEGDTTIRVEKQIKGIIESCNNIMYIIDNIDIVRNDKVIVRIIEYINGNVSSGNGKIILFSKNRFIFKKFEILSLLRNYVHAELQPLNDSDVRRFIKSILMNIKSKSLHYQPYYKIVSKILSSDMRRNPFTLLLICWKIISDESSSYSETSLLYWSSMKSIHSALLKSGERNFSAIEIFRILSALAFQLYREGSWRYFSVEFAHRAIKSLSKMNGFPEIRNAESIINIAISSNIFVKETFGMGSVVKDRIYFSHPTIYRFMVSFALSDFEFSESRFCFMKTEIVEILQRRRRDVFEEIVSLSDVDVYMRAMPLMNIGVSESVMYRLLINDDISSKRCNCIFVGEVLSRIDTAVSPSIIDAFVSCCIDIMDERDNKIMYTSLELSIRKLFSSRHALNLVGNLENRIRKALFLSSNSVWNGSGSEFMELECVLRLMLLSVGSDHPDLAVDEAFRSSDEGRSSKIISMVRMAVGVIQNQSGNNFNDLCMFKNDIFGSNSNIECKYNIGVEFYIVCWVYYNISIRSHEFQVSDLIGNLMTLINENGNCFVRKLAILYSIDLLLRLWFVLKIDIDGVRNVVLRMSGVLNEQDYNGIFHEIDCIQRGVMSSNEFDGVFDFVKNMTVEKNEYGKSYTIKIFLSSMKTKEKNLLDEKFRSIVHHLISICGDLEFCCYYPNEFILKNSMPILESASHMIVFSNIFKNENGRECMRKGLLKIISDSKSPDESIIACIMYKFYFCNAGHSQSEDLVKAIKYNIFIGNVFPVDFICAQAPTQTPPLIANSGQ